MANNLDFNNYCHENEEFIHETCRMDESDKDDEIYKKTLKLLGNYEKEEWNNRELLNRSDFLKGLYKNTHKIIKNIQEGIEIYNNVYFNENDDRRTVKQIEDFLINEELEGEITRDGLIKTADQISILENKQHELLTIKRKIYDFDMKNKLRKKYGYGYNERYLFLRIPVKDTWNNFLDNKDGRNLKKHHFNTIKSYKKALKKTSDVKMLKLLMDFIDIQIPKKNLIKKEYFLSKDDHSVIFKIIPELWNCNDKKIPIRMKNLVRAVSDSERKKKFKVFNSIKMPPYEKFIHIRFPYEDIGLYVKNEIDDEKLKDLVSIKLSKRDLEKKVSIGRRVTYIKMPKKTWEDNIKFENENGIEVQISQEEYDKCENEYIDNSSLNFVNDYFVGVSSKVCKDILEGKNNETISIRIPHEPLIFLKIPSSNSEFLDFDYHAINKRIYDAIEIQLNKTANRIDNPIQDYLS